MKSIYKTLIFVTIFLAAACSNLPEIDGPGKKSKGKPAPPVAYVEEFKSSQIAFTADDKGGSTVITPRLSSLQNEPMGISLEVDSKFLEQYNAKNGTSYQILPEELYSLQLLDEKGNVVKEGKKIDFAIAANKIATQVRVKVSGMSIKSVDESGAEVMKSLPTYQNYAIPVKLNTLSYNAPKIQSTSSAALCTINRKFKAKALHMQASRFAVIYKTEEKTLENEPKYPEYTYQVFLRFDSFLNNTGFVYPNYRNGTSEHWGYNCLYGSKGWTMFTPAGKFNFNQKDFIDYEFKTNRWYNIAGTFSEGKDGKLGKFKLYVDGKLAFEQNISSPSQQWEKFIIGNGSFRGYIRDVRLWNRVLSEGEINSTMFAVKPDAEGLVMYLPLDGDYKSLVPGKEKDWVNITDTSKAHFNTIFNFPEE